MFVKNGKLQKEGNLTLIYLIMYSVVRIFVETFRIDSVNYVFGLPIAIFVSISIILVSTIIFIIHTKRKNK